MTSLFGWSIGSGVPVAPAASRAHAAIAAVVIRRDTSGFMSDGSPAGHGRFESRGRAIRGAGALVSKESREGVVSRSRQAPVKNGLFWYCSPPDPGWAGARDRGGHMEFETLTESEWDAVQRIWDLLDEDQVE